MTSTTTANAYAIDPEIAAALAATPSPLDLAAADIPAIRELMRQAKSVLPPPLVDPPVYWEDITIPGPAGAPEIPVRLYRPAEPPSGPTPGLTYFHGGAFYIGDLDTEHLNCLRATVDTGCVTVSVDYRLAPEHPFPAGVDDCYAGLQWLSDNAGTLGVDTSRLAVGGSSAGGALAAAVALMARDRKGPALCFQLLCYPVIDDRMTGPSMAFADVPVWTGPATKRMWELYLGDDHRGDVSPYAAPGRATDLSGLPPAYVMTCEFDPLRDEGIEYAVRLQHAGVATELHHFPGTVHGFDLMALQAAVTRRAHDDKFAALAAAFRTE